LDQKKLIVLDTVICYTYSMKKIGNGLQYVAYDAGRGRVFKRPTTKREKIAKLKSWDFKTAATIDKKLKSIRKHGLVSINTLRNILLNKSINAELIGNPTFTGKLSYTQDKVTPIGEFIKTHTLRENRRVLKNYIALEHKLWQYGISDDARKPTVNNGVRKNGEVILLDFGECTFQKSKIVKDIKNNTWLSQRSLENLQDRHLRDFLINLIAKEITLEKLNYFWKQNIQ
jgi:hypothetical protein